MNDSLKILILEDDSALNELIRRRLVRENHECCSFYRAQELLDWLALNTGDLIIMDLVLPDYSGEELISIFRQKGINIPFIVATGQGSEAIAVKLLKKGAKDYLVKNSEFLDTLPSAVEMVWREIQLQNLLDKAREQLYVQNATLSSVYEFSPQGILVLDKNDKIISYNQHLLKIWSLSENQLLSTGEAFFREIAGKINESGIFIESVLNIPGERKGLILSDIKHEDKTYELYSNPMIRDNGGNYGRIWYFLDITIHKNAQEAIQKAKMEVENNSRLRSRFFALISHDVKAPLNSIIGFIELLNKTPINQTQKEYIDIIRTSGEHLLTLINDILDLTRIEHGAMEFHVQQLSTSELLSNCINSYMPQSKETGVELFCEIDKDVPEIISGDLVRLRQILFNIFGNAMKFTRKGYVKLRCFLKNADFINIQVIDTGIGIEKNVQKAIFSPFSQADSSITQLYGGTGLGLTVAKQLVEKMGGELTLESEPGKGACFSFSIPVNMRDK